LEKPAITKQTGEITMEATMIEGKLRGIINILVNAITAIAVISLCYATNVYAKDKVNVAFFSWPGYAYWFLVKEKNLAPDLDINITIIEDPSESFGLMAAGKLDVISSTMEYAPIAVEAKLPIKFVMFQDTCHGSDSIILAPNIKDAKDVKGKKFIAMQGGLSQIFAGWWLEKNGLGVNDVQWVNLIMDDAAAGMTAGDAAAGEFWEPYASTVLKGLKGSHIATNCREDDWKKTALLSDGIFMNSNFIANHRDVAQKVLKAYWAAYDFWLKNPEEATKIMAAGIKFPVENVQNLVGPGGDRKKSLLWMYNFQESASICGVGPGNPPFGQTNGQLFDVVKKINEWWLKFGLMKTTVPPEQAVDCSLMADLQKSGSGGK
jgi:NitT/TauT family transport system substrate-binding protein